MLIEMGPTGLKFKILVLLSMLIILKADYLEDNYPATVIEDAKLDVPHLLMKYKYPVETHFVTTVDKYILALHRIPNPKAKPVFLMHGLLDSSGTWILMGPWSGLGYYLYDQGYDVWMGNARGNRYSRNHTTYDPTADKSFWKFSWHEIGIYDLPTMIDYVLEKTNHEKLTYFGHSQGTTTFFVMCSMLPAYNAKINSMQAFAPVAFLKHVKSPLQPLARNLNTLTNVMQEFSPHTPMFLKSCFISKTVLDTCVDFLMQVMGKDLKEINGTMWPVIFGQLPAGASSRQGRHYLQLIDSDRFQQYDHGPVENMRLYRSTKPPEYPIENIKVPIGLFYASNDYLTNDVDVQRLARLLPNVVENNLFPYKKWNHISMIWGISSRELVQKHVLEVIKKFE